MWRALLLLIVLCGMRPTAWAKNAPPTEQIELRRFNEKEITALKNDPGLQYDKELQREPSWWERFKEWLSKFFERLAGPAVGDFVGSNLFIIICLLVVLLAIIILARGGLRRVFHGAPRALGEVTTLEEDIRGLDLEAMIREAEEANDLRRAIRLHYLLVLRKLVDQEVLKWSPEYTDQDYMRQVRDPALRSRFAHVALVFQWVWYGHAEVDAERYASLKRPFIEFETAPVT